MELLFHYTADLQAVKSHKLLTQLFVYCAFFSWVIYI